MPSEGLQRDGRGVGSHLGILRHAAPTTRTVGGKPAAAPASALRVTLADEVRSVSSWISVGHHICLWHSRQRGWTMTREMNRSFASLPVVWLV